MINNPNPDSFVVTLPDNFFYKEVKKTYEPYFNQKNFMFSNITDFISSSIISINFNGLKLNANKQQSGKNSEKRAYRSGLPSKEAYKTTLSVKFRSYQSFVNYFILFDQLKAYNDSEYQSEDPQNLGDDTVLPSISTFITGEDGEILFQRVYSKLVFVSIDDLILDKTSMDAKNTNFTCIFEYSDVQLISYIEKTQNVTKKEYIY
jgi:hypothetical protein